MPSVQPTLRNPAPEQLLSSSRKVDSPRAQSTVAPQKQDNEAAGSSAPVVPERSNTESARAHGCKVRLPKLTLKKFGGDITLWSSFWDSFESSIHNNPDLTDIDKFNYLHSLLEHTAAEAIAGLTLSSSNYEEAIALLKKRFGSKQQLISKHMKALLNLEAVTSSRDLKNLRQLYDKVESHVRCLKSLDNITSASYGSLLSSILMK